MRLGKKLGNKITYIKKLDVASLIIVLAMFLVLIAGIFVVSDNYKENQEKLIEDAMELQSQSHKEKFETFIEDKVKLLQGIASFPAVSSMVPRKQSELLKNRAKELGFLHLFVMDTKGQGFYIDEGITKDQSTEPFFYNVSGNHVYITEPFYGKEQTFTTVCVSIFDIKEEKIGTLCGAVKLDSLKGVLAEAETLLDGELILVNREGTYIYSKNMQKVYDKEKIYDEKKSDYELVAQSFDTKRDQMGVITIDGKEYKAYVTYLADFDWAIIQCVEMSRIFEDLKYIDVVKYGALFIVIVLIICVSRIAIHWRASQRRINTDTLTGCNSRAAMEALIDNVDKAVDQDLTLIYLDLNKFKYVNDTYGHEVGDKVLCVYSKSLMKIFGRIGFVGRMGGDEFMVILTGVKKDVALKLCQKLESILVEDSKQLDFDYTISTSYGIATRLKGSYTPIEDLMVEADERMYNFKEEHR